MAQANLPTLATGEPVVMAAGEPMVRFPMFAALDEKGRLFVAESSGEDLYAELQKQTRRCRVRRLEDTDGDGVYDRAVTFADQLVFPMGVAAHRGKIFVPDPPNLLVFEDRDDDGQADAKRVLLTGFGHKDNGSLHGVLIGPDEQLYMTIGWPDGYRLKREDGVELSGETGAVIRCRLDGSRVRVLARGFENPVELAFMPAGQMVITNNWFYEPRGGMRDALVHIVNGGVYPRHFDYEKYTPKTGPELPAIALMPAVAHSGIMRARFGTGGGFGGVVYTAEHNARKVRRHVLEPIGSTFAAVSSDFVVSEDPDFHPSDVLEDADGSVLIVDTGGWYVQHCPTGRIRHSMAPGGIYRARPAESLRRVDDPYGLSIDWAASSNDQLAERLADARPFVRDAARRAMADRGVAAAEAVMHRTDAATEAGVALMHEVIDALTATADTRADDVLRGLAGSQDGRIAAHAARALFVREAPAAAELTRLLARVDEPMVRLAAAEALTPCGGASATAGLIAALAAGEIDAHLSHALIHALHAHGSGEWLTAALDHADARVQRAAMIALNQPPHESLTAQQVMARAGSVHEELRAAAIEIIRGRPTWAEHAATLMADWLKERGDLPASDAEALRAYAVGLSGDEGVAGLIRDAASGQLAVPMERRVMMLEAMAEHERGDLPRGWPAAVAAALGDADLTVRRTAVGTAASLRINAWDDALAAIADDEQLPADLRVNALAALLPRRPTLDDGRFSLLAGQLEVAGPTLDRLAAIHALSLATLTKRQLAWLIDRATKDAMIGPEMVLSTAERSGGESSAELLVYIETKLRAGWRPTAGRLDAALTGANDAARAAAIRRLVDEGEARQRELLARYEPLLQGGDAKRGERLFFSKATCAVCHRVGNRGGETGPDLTSVGAIRSPRDLLEAVALPSASIAQKYDTYLVQTTGGAAQLGTLESRTAAAIVLRDITGRRVRLPANTVLSVQRLDQSLMPEGLLAALSDDEVRDLLAYLRSRKP